METNENKQLTELSDEELKKVTGGYLSSMPTMACKLGKCRELGKKTNPKTCECE